LLRILAVHSGESRITERTAVDAAPWLLGGSEPREEIPPEKLYDRLKPFMERVAEGIRGSKTESE
jgi:hypothetical protein